jgi:hypothetical protein
MADCPLVLVMAANRKELQPMTEAAAIEETVNAKMISTLLVIYRIARRALSAEQRNGQQYSGTLAPRSRGCWCSWRLRSWRRGIAEGGSRAA